MAEQPVKRVCWPDWLFKILILLNGLIILWGLDKGFEIRDEAFALLNYRFPHAYHFGSFFQLMVSKLLFGFQPSILDVRAMGVGLRLIAVGIFTWGFSPWLKSILPQEAGDRWFLRWPFLLALFILADWFVFTRYNMFLTYNTMNAACLYIATGLLLAFLGRNRFREDVKSFKLLALAGLFMGIDLFIKFPTSLAFAPLAVLVLVAHGFYFKTFKPLKSLLWFTGGYLGGLLLFFLLVKDPMSWWHELRAGAERAIHNAYTPKRIINKYLGDYVRLLKWTVTRYLLPLLVISGGLAVTGKLSLQKLRPVVLMFAFIWLAWTCWHQDHFWGLLLFYWLLGLLLVIVKAAVCLFDRTFETRQNVSEINNLKACGATWLYPLLMALFLATLNFCGIFGTAAGIATSFSSYIVLPTAGLIVLLSLLPTPRMQTLAALFLFVALQLAWPRMFIFEGNRYLDNRLAQTVAVRNVPSLKGIRLDPDRAAFFGQLHQIVEQHKKHADKPPVVLAMLGMPGLVYALNGYAPEAPYIAWMSFAPKIKPFYCSMLEDFSRQLVDQQQDWFVLVEEKMPPESLDSTNKFLVQFKPVRKIWNPNNNEWLTIYTRP